MRCAHQLAQRLGERFRALACAGDDENTGAVAITVRQVNRALPLRFGERGLLHCADDADNCKQLRVVFFVTERDPLAERAAVEASNAGPNLRPPHRRVPGGENLPR